MSITTEFPNIFKPIKVGPLTLKNRIQCSPMVSAQAETLSGNVTQELVAFIGSEAKTGAGLVTIGSTPVDFDRGRDFYGCLSATRDSDVPQLKKLADEAHRWGAKLSAEIMHAGRIAYPAELHGKKAFVPWLAPDMDPEHFEEITHEQMQEVISHFQKAALRLKAAGFDMVMIHAAHGNLVSAFFSSVYNKRTDEYGGSLENRMRFTTEIAKAVREAVGPDMGIDIRISSAEFVEGSPSLDDIATLINTLSPYINCAHLSGGLIFDPTKEIYMMPTYYQERSLNADRAAYIKSKVHIPITVVGNIPNIYEAEKILADGKADMVAMARNILADGDLIHKAYRGEADTIRECIHCCECARLGSIGASVRCAVNPMRGQEDRYPRIEKAQVRKKVMIVGGGPAGMQAAQVSAKRGHDVLLYEAGSRLGGHFNEASSLSYKDFHRHYLAWDIRETMECGAKIVLNTPVTPELVEKEAPDTLILALGAEHIRPNIKGIETSCTVSDIDLERVKAGKRVVYCGGGVSSTESAIGLAESGHECVILDFLPYSKLHLDVFGNVKAALKYKMDEDNIKFYDETRVTEIGPNYVKAVRDGKELTFDCDTVVTGFGLAPDKEIIESLNGIVYETYVIGDANKVGKVMDANRDAFNVCIEL